MGTLPTESKTSAPG